MSEFDTLWAETTEMLDVLTSFVCRKLRCPGESARDLIYTTLATVFLQRANRNLPPIREPRAFVWVAVERAVVNEQRSRARQAQRFVALGTDAHNAPTRGGVDDPAETASADDTLRFITEVLAERVSPEDRAVYERIADGSSYGEVCEEFGIVGGTARSKVSRVREILRQALAEQSGG